MHAILKNALLFVKSYRHLQTKILPTGGWADISRHPGDTRTINLYMPYCGQSTQLSYGKAPDRDVLEYGGRPLFARYMLEVSRVSRKRTVSINLVYDMN